MSRRRPAFRSCRGLSRRCARINALWFFAQRSGRAPAVAAARAAERPDARHARCNARALRHRAAAKPRGGERAGGGRRRGGDRLSGGAENPLRRHRAQDRSRRRRARSRAAAQDVLAAADALTAAAQQSHPDAKIDGFLVQEMVSGVEAIVGAQSDPLYGPLLLVGAGGVLVELVRDAALRLLPVSERDVTAMIDGLKLKQLLAGFRGKPPADRKALEAAALALGAVLSRSPRQNRRDRDQSADGAPAGRGRRSTCASPGEQGETEDGFRASRRTAHLQGIAAALRRHRADPDRAGDDAAERREAEAGVLRALLRSAPRTSASG